MLELGCPGLGLVSIREAEHLELVILTDQNCPQCAIAGDQLAYRIPLPLVFCTQVVTVQRRCCSNELRLRHQRTQFKRQIGEADAAGFRINSEWSFQVATRISYT